MFFKKRKKEPENIEEILNSFQELKKEVILLREEIEEMKEISRSSVRGVGVVRFNPFSDVGGDQSFSLAILNDNGDGAVITGYYTREGSNVYSKAIKGGKSNYVLAEEEIRAIEIASKKETI